VRELENLIERAVILAESDTLTCAELSDTLSAPGNRRSAPPTPERPLSVEEYIRETVERYQDRYSETELARILGIGRKALWTRRRQWGLLRNGRSTRRD